MRIKEALVAIIMIKLSTNLLKLFPNNDQSKDTEFFCLLL